MRDPARRPSNDRVKTAPIDATVTIKCRHCQGDGWNYPEFGADRWKVTCWICKGQGWAVIYLMDKKPTDLVIDAAGGIPTGWTANG